MMKMMMKKKKKKKKKKKNDGIAMRAERVAGNDVSDGRRWVRPWCHTNLGRRRASMRRRQWWADADADADTAPIAPPVRRWYSSPVRRRRVATWSAPSIRSKWISAKKIKNNKKKKIIRKQKILHVIRKMCNSDAGCHVLDFLALTFLFRTFDLIFRDKPSVDFFLFSRRRRVKGILKKKRSKKRLRIAPVSVLLPSFTGFYLVLLEFS